MAGSGPRLAAVMRIRTSSGSRLGVLDEDVEVAVLGEDAGVDQLELGILLAAAAVLLDQSAVGELRLRILVEHLHVRVRRRRVEVEVVLLHVLAVVALVAGEAEQALLEDRVAPVPERQGEAQVLRRVADAGEAVLVPAVDPRARVVVREVVPGGAVRAVVLAHGAPGPFAQSTAPTAPGRAVLLEAVPFDAHGGAE